MLKLYEPLPGNITEKSIFQIEELVGDSVLYEVVTDVSSIDKEEQLQLRGPNFNIDLVEENNNPTGFLNFNELFNFPVSSSFYEVYSLFNEKGAQISVDHTDYDGFIQFSSAEERLRNFRYKVGLLESFENDKDNRTAFTASIEENIRNIVNNFDHYDRYLYFETGSKAWPKSTATRPYTLYSTGSAEVATWFTSSLISASAYDFSNPDKLTNSIPSFLKDDTNNAPYSLFVDMIGQHFDNLWIYSKAVTDKYDADNRLDFGISKDLVRDAIENYGISLYNNNESLENLFAAFTGEQYNTGSEDIRSLIVAVEGSGSLTGSVGNEHLQPMPKASYQKEVYKRIYHNIPLLLKSKGTERGLRALINSLGIPSDVLTINTFGGGIVTGSLFYGPDTEVTSSLDKIRISNSDSVVTGSVLSEFTSVVKPGNDYSTDLHTVEVGFSPATSLNKYIKAHPSMSSFNIDEYIGDPGLIYSSSYSSLDNLADTVFISGSTYVNNFNALDFVRLIKFFDNSVFRIIKDFIPARSNISSGIVIKPHILDRSKAKQPEVKWSNQTPNVFDHNNTILDYTGSNYNTNFAFEGNIETAFMTGSSGLSSIYTASYTEYHPLPSGSHAILTRNNNDQASFTGEYSGSNLTISTGELNDENTFKYFPTSSTNFSGSDYFATVNNVHFNRKSTERLKVDEASLSPSTGRFAGTFLPLNFEVISSSIANGTNGVLTRNFAEVQDSNYSSLTWKTPRYEGVEANNRRRGIRVLGLEPVQSFNQFNSFQFPLSASNEEIRGFYSTFEDSAGSEKGDTVVYYNKYESRLLGVVENTFVSTSLHGGGGFSTPNAQSTGFSFSLDNTITLYRFDGHIGEYIDGGDLKVSFDVAYSFFNDSDISSSAVPSPAFFEVNLVDGNGDVGRVRMDSASIEYTDGVFISGGPSEFTEKYRYTLELVSDVVTKDAIIRITDGNLNTGGAVTAGLTFNNFAITKSTFVPDSTNEPTIIAETEKFKTFFYREVTPTPSNPNGYEVLANSKLYRLDTGKIYSTNNLGIVTDIE